MKNRKLIKTEGEFRLYQNGFNQYEIWFVNSFMGYIADPENFVAGIDAAREEIRCLMAEVI